MKRMMMAGFCTLLLAGCVSTEGARDLPEITPQDLTKAQEAIVKAGIAQKLSNPSTAQFGPIYGGKQNDSTYYACGTVNSKGSFNAYTGVKHYVGRLEKNVFVLEALGDADYQDQIALGLCQQYGMM